MKKQILALVVVSVACTMFTMSCSQTPVTAEYTPTTESAIDSMFALLIERVQATEGVSYNTFAAMDFASLSAGFDNAAIQYPNNAKANVGCLVSSLMALNSSSSIKKLVDSLQAYNDYNNTPEEPIAPYAASMAKAQSSDGALQVAYKKQGVQNLGMVLLASTPSVLMAQTQYPSWPKFVKLSYIQTIIQNEVLPALNKAIAAAARMESTSGMTLPIVVEGDTTMVDVGDVYIVDGGLHLLRAMLAMYTAYDYDLFTSASDQTYSWIDKVVNTSNIYQKHHLQHDTLYHTYVFNAAALTGVCEVLNYNFTQRSGFLTIRNAVHAKAYADLKAVPVLIKSGLNIIHTQDTSNQANHMISQKVIFEMDSGMVDMPQQMRDRGYSESLSNNFRTPATLMDFISQVLSGPYSFDETIDSVNVALTVDLSAYFTNPIQDLKTTLPKHIWHNKSDWVTYDTFTSYVSSGSYSNVVYVSSNDSFNIASSLIDSITTDIYGARRVFLKSPYLYRASRDSNAVVMPFALTDMNGTELDIKTLVDTKQFFPYFDDYTFHGIFPGMTRAKWMNLFYQN